MGLIRGIARTAAIAGTATAVSNRVTRRQRARWASREYPAPAPSELPVNHEMAEDHLAGDLDRLTTLHQRGQLTDDEFAAAKARLLGR